MPRIGAVAAKAALVAGLTLISTFATRVQADEPPNVHREILPGPRLGTVSAVVPNAGPELDWSFDDTPAHQPPAGRGLTWTRMTCPNVYIKAISMLSPQVGFCAAELGIVLRTTDGGDTWQTILNQGFPYYYYGVQTFAPNTVLITGFQNQTGEGILRWSDDGGASWGPIVVLTAPSYFDWLAFVKFVDANRGVIQGWGGGVFYTTTGGRTAGDWLFSWPTQNWWQGPFTFLP